MEYINETIIKLVSNEICKNELYLSVKPPFSDEFYRELYDVSRTHDVTHIVGLALANNGIQNADSIGREFKNSIFSLMYRYENVKFASENVCNALEEAKIPYIPLKGEVIRKLYPQEWMRTGCDIDILIHESDVDAAAKFITCELGYREDGRGTHDVQLLSPDGVCVELHFRLIEERQSLNFTNVLDRAWDYARPTEGGKYRYELSDDMLYFYHVAHMAKHFVQGGCGLRSFIDLWLLNQSKNLQTPQIRSLLEEGGLSKFEHQAYSLSRVWFSGDEHSEATAAMENFIMSGGQFGTSFNYMLLEQHKSGGRLKYFASRIFIPFEDLKRQYSTVNKYPFLAPFFQISRLFSLIFGARKKFRKYSTEKLIKDKGKGIKNTDAFFESLGL